MPDQEAGRAPDAAPRVLVVDDELDIRKIFSTALTQKGYEVQTAGDAREALLVLMKDSFDVAIVDLKMHDMNGIVFLQEALKIWPRLGVIIASGYVTEEALEKATELNITHVLNKPVRLNVLCDTVAEEYEAKRKVGDDISTGNALTLMRNHLSFLTRLSQNVVGNETLFDALLEFGDSLARMFPANTVGILVMEKKPALLLAVKKPVAQTFLDSVEKEMMERYSALSGKNLAAGSLELQLNGEAVQPGAASAFESSISVPVMLEGEVHGLLTLASEYHEAYGRSDISLLYHAANHISAAFTALRKMHHLVTRDPLTGVFNRIRLEEELERTWLISHRYSYSMAVIIVDIDHFKTLNDSYGHGVGDDILCAFAEVMQDVARSTDVIARYGGDEFVAVLPRADETDALAFGERLVEKTRNHSFGRDGHNLGLTVSVGVSTSLNPTKPVTCGELLSQADRALYTAKRAGRNRICLWPERPAGAAGEDGDVIEEADPAPEATHIGRVILIDDELSILKVLEAMLKFDGYDVTPFISATEALEAIRTQPGHYDVLLTDLGLPDISGLEVLRQAAEFDDSLIKIVITGQATVDNAINSLREGAYDFIQKPVIRDQLQAMMHRAMQVRELRTENSRHQIHLEETVCKRSAQLASSLEEIRRSYEFTLEAMVAMLDAREHQTARHSLKTRELAVTLAQRAGVPSEDLQSLATGALLHDIGKIGIPDSVLLHEGPLTDEQWEIMKQHPEIGYNVLKASPYLKESAQVVYQHQEWYDGSGYPQQLKGKQICIGARIFAVVDAYDAMRSLRVYRKPVPPEKALASIMENSGTQFDPEIVKVFIKCQDEFERLLAKD